RTTLMMSHSASHGGATSVIRSAREPPTSMVEMINATDIRGVLQAIRIPTLVVARTDTPIGSGHGRYLAEQIAGATYVDLPGRGIRCAEEIHESLRPIGVDVRAGLHTGEVDLVDGDVGGIAVHLGARVMAEANAGETVVSSTVKDLVVGSGIAFEDRGEHYL